MGQVMWEVKDGWHGVGHEHQECGRSRTDDMG